MLMRESQVKVKFVRLDVTHKVTCNVIRTNHTDSHTEKMAASANDRKEKVKFEYNHVSLQICLFFQNWRRKAYCKSVLKINGI